ncbi:quinol:cytochrome C oxidoreductase [Arcticibacterium luteifluviistationis]|uniref:Quinol:cytochrome C oxidoreductase n=1 Tax=Arcticibacterium luteifluviistationis TaxID=1784714 RepID=A0A2Z4GFN8_9BACT|nr:quinol:cytochrome C oxidoreductase [Arcticibacterium luteifluviistationis]AWW00061.1 quinol:cytochrome C oxidoreductase [Arcticibacterium luteifluviistationis]
MAHKHETPSVEESYDFSPELKRKLVIGGVIGVALVAIGVFLINMGWWGPDGFAGGAHEAHGAVDAHGAAEAAHGAGEHAAEGHHEATLMNRIVGNLWMNSIYFLGLSVIGVFFISYNYVAKAGWYTSFKRVPEALPAFLIVPAAVILILFAIPGSRHIIMHWTHEGIMDPLSNNYDAIIAGKSWWLNVPFYVFRLVSYFVVWWYLWKQIRKYSLLEDVSGSLEDYNKSRLYAKFFLIFFAVTSSTAAWDLSMAVDAHWFSTMFGWYHLSSWHVSGLAAIMLIIITLKDQGYLKGVNDSAIQDLGKLIFGFSIFWTYVWFSQFFLIFYAHLPEETIYFRERLHGYEGRYLAPFYISLVLNFVFPLLILMARGSKRNYTFLKLACWAILIGHWFDFYQMLMPAIAKNQGGIGLIEVGITTVFACSFIYVIYSQLSKANMYAKNHPFLEESLHHDI